MDPGFLVGGDDGGAEGPERGAVGAKRRSAERSGLGRGAIAPTPRYEVWGHSHQKIFEI